VIAILLNRHKSWVCRRLALIERLSDVAQEMIRLGLLTPSLGTELSRLQRRNQDLLLAAIREHRLSVRETKAVITALESGPQSDHESLLRDPRGLLSAGACPAPAQEKGVSREIKKALYRLSTLERNCLETALLVARIDPVMYPPHEENRLRVACGRVLPSLCRADHVLRGMATYGKMGEP
jgi:hypothetical protein